MSVLLLTGPPGAGKNTVAEHLAKRKTHCAIIDVDHLRRMVFQPHVEIWEGEEGPRQQRLSVDNACALARNFNAVGYDVVITDAITDTTLAQYRADLGALKPWIVQLLPDESDVNAWLLSRPDYLSRGEVSWLYQQQASLEGYDDKLDCTDAVTAVDWLLQHWPA